MSYAAAGARSDEGMDLRELGFILARGKFWILGGAVLGLFLGLAVVLFVPPRYKGTASVLLRSQGAQPGGAALTELSDLLGALPIGFGASAVETETSILTSRAVLGEVVDSLGLQVRVIEPREVSPGSLFEVIELDPAVSDAEYVFERQNGGYSVDGPGVAVTAEPGVTLSLEGGQLTLARGELPDRFTILVRDRETAISDVEDDLTADVIGGEVVEVVYRTGGAGLAAAVPNAIISRYLDRRRTTDRGVNQYRYEFLTGHVDSISKQLAAAESARRRQQEASGVFDPTLAAESGLERVADLRAQLENAEVESRALRGVLQKAESGSLSPRELAAYPTFIGNPAINGILSNLLSLETQRLVILQRRRSADDPEVLPLTNSIEHLESQLVVISTDYLEGVLRREAELRAELAAREAEVDQLPAQAEAGSRLEREVLRLSETQIALQTQLVAARLGAISEGGDVRQVDVAVPPEEPVFPNAIFSLAGGLLGGLFFGTIAAVGAGRLRRTIFSPIEAEIATGIPTIALGPLVPLSFPELNAAPSLLLIPAGDAEVVPVGERIVTTAALQGRDAILADLTRNGSLGRASRFADHIPVGRIGPGGTPSAVADAETELYAVYQAQTNGHVDGRAVLSQLEGRSSLVVAALPQAGDPSTVSVLAPDRPVVIVARAGVTRETLQETIEACTRMGALVLRIVLLPTGVAR